MSAVFLIYSSFIIVFLYKRIPKYRHNEYRKISNIFSTELDTQECDEKFEKSEDLILRQKITELAARVAVIAGRIEDPDFLSLLHELKKQKSENMRENLFDLILKFAHQPLENFELTSEKEPINKASSYE